MSTTAATAPAPSAANDDPLLDINEVVILLGVSEDYIFQAIKCPAEKPNRLPYEKISGAPDIRVPGGRAKGKWDFRGVRVRKSVALAWKEAGHDQTTKQELERWRAMNFGKRAADMIAKSEKSMEEGRRLERIITGSGSNGRQ